MGVRLFAPPLGLALDTALRMRGVPIEVTVTPMMKYLACSSSVSGDRVRAGADASVLPRLRL